MGKIGHQGKLLKLIAWHLLQGTFQVLERLVNGISTQDYQHSHGVINADSCGDLGSDTSTFRPELLLYSSLGSTILPGTQLSEMSAQKQQRVMPPATESTRIQVACPGDGSSVTHSRHSRRFSPFFLAAVAERREGWRSFWDTQVLSPV